MIFSSFTEKLKEKAGGLLGGGGGGRGYVAPLPNYWGGGPGPPGPPSSYAYDFHLTLDPRLSRVRRLYSGPTR